MTCSDSGAPGLGYSWPSYRHNSYSARGIQPHTYAVTAHLIQLECQEHLQNASSRLQTHLQHRTVEARQTGTRVLSAKHCSDMQSLHAMMQTGVAFLPLFHRRLVTQADISCQRSCSPRLALLGQQQNRSACKVKPIHGLVGK